jgi:hypothetical protein
MKRIAAFVLLAVTSLTTTQNASAQPGQHPHYQTVQYTVPPVAVRTVCNVNGVDYPVDFGSRIWGRNAYDQWFVIGRIVATPTGYVGVRLDGVTFPAFCQ